MIYLILAWLDIQETISKDGLVTAARAGVVIMPGCARGLSK